MKNTDWIKGVVIYTGHETKIMKNSVKSKAKLSKLEKATNRYILLMVLIQIVICLISACFYTVWTLSDEKSYGYLDIDTT